MSNLFSGSTDLDNIFEPRGSFAKRADVGVYNGGTDISNLYAPVSHGSPAANTGIYSGSTDIGQLFAAKGSVVYWDGSLSDLPASESDQGSSSAIALVEIIFYSNGEIRSHQNYPFADTLIGHWHGKIANSSNTEIRFVVTAGALDQNSAPSFKPLTLRQNFFVKAEPDGGFQSSSATVRVELQLVGDSSTRISKEITVTASHSGDSGGFPGI
ncbi:hypothetical protein [Microbulbifer thermotolerans]|uniref:hypothetical protein n=1 Tax=Microbulbifer thermotolerans TaxID=252514 RepID=UPI00224B93F0|nr:hypothetical protein [Microbulbifer thermotolerans]MCX2834449.1 hypothetical protein [Microbulbifer thermotolerans]